MPTRALLNDVNPHLINFYRWLQRGLVVSITLENLADRYYEHRSRFNDLARGARADSSEAAALFYYLNRTGYNGLCRFNRGGAFNVPHGRYRHVVYERDFLSYRDVVNAWQFTSTDVERVPIEPSDFVYADPPYDVDFTQYACSRFSWDDQQRTASFLASHPGPVVLTNQATARVELLYRALGFSIQILDAPRRICRNGDRSPAKEIVATRHL